MISRELAQYGEADIIAQFRARHLELVRLAALLLGDHAAAEDIVQDVFAKVWAARHRLAADGVSAAYFHRSVLNALPVGASASDCSTAVRCQS